MTSKALRSTHEMYGDGEMDLHLYTDVITLDKLTIQVIIVFASVSLIVFNPLCICIPRLVSIPLCRADCKTWLFLAGPSNPNPEQQEQDAVEEHLGPSAHAMQEEEPICITIDHVSAPLIGVLVLLATTTIGSEQVHQGIVGEDGIKPYDMLALFISLIKKLVKWQSTHDNKLPTSKDHDAFLKLQNRIHQESAQQHHGEAPETQLKLKDAEINSFKSSLKCLEEET
ncbi:hypothetical protein NDA13_006422 [Ustilago tritici]|nr:hypothetical protein NDA13_006422 [Ustilago tritici]